MANVVRLIGKDIVIRSEVRASGRNDLGSNFILCSSFTAEIDSNFIIAVRNTSDHKHPQPIREAFWFWFLGQRSFVTIYLID